MSSFNIKEYLDEKMNIHKVDNAIILLPKNIYLLDNFTENTVNSEFKIVSSNLKNNNLHLEINLKNNIESTNNKNTTNIIDITNSDIINSDITNSDVTNNDVTNSDVTNNDIVKNTQNINNNKIKYNNKTEKNFIKENIKNIKKNDNRTDKILRRNKSIKKVNSIKTNNNLDNKTNSDSSKLIKHIIDNPINNKDNIESTNNLLNKFIKQVSTIIINQTKIDNNNNFTQKNFINTFNHQVKTPLNGLALGIQILDEVCKTEFHRSIINNLYISCIELSKYVNDIIDYYLLLHDKCKFKYTEFEIMDVINESIDYFKTTLKLNKINFKIKINKNFPNKITSDINKLKQIINNLLENSIKFTYNDIIQINVNYIDNNIIFKIQDNGIGIKENDKPHLFKPFFQSSDENKSPDGLGLGLAITKLIIDKFNGDISFIQSEFKTAILIVIPNNLNSPTNILCNSIESFNQEGLFKNNYFLNNINIEEKKLELEEVYNRPKEKRNSSYLTLKKRNTKVDKIFLNDLKKVFEEENIKVNNMEIKEIDEIKERKKKKKKIL